MRAGDLVKCTWQPGTKAAKNGGLAIMDIRIVGQYGLLLRSRDNDYSTWYVYFPRYNYIHPLATTAFEVLSD